MESRLCLGSGVGDGTSSMWLFVRIFLKHLQKLFPHPHGHQVPIFFLTQPQRDGERASKPAPLPLLISTCPTFVQVPKETAQETFGEFCAVAGGRRGWGWEEYPSTGGLELLSPTEQPRYL